MCIATAERIRVTEHTILYNYEVKPGYYLMGFECDGLRYAKPGQFLSMSLNRIQRDMPIRRPFTIYKLIGNKVEILYKIVGRGTQLFATLNEGEKVNILGPLGNTFDITPNSNSLIIGRGCGLATLANLGNGLKKAGCNVTTLASFRNERVNFVDDYIEGFSDELIVVHDEDGTSDLENMKNIISRVNPDFIYCSGSTRLAKMLQNLPYKSYVNLEERMGCGLGACLTCPVQTPTGYKRVCKDGPCFDVREVIL